MLGVRLDSETERGLDRLARQLRRTKSDIAREAIVRHVERHDTALIAEARRQSIHAAQSDSASDDSFWESVSAWNDDN